MPPMKVTKYSALLALLMTSGLVHAQTEVNQEITAPTWNAANSTDTYAETVASLNATGLTPAEIAAEAAKEKDKKKKPASYGATYNLLPRN